MVKIRTLGIIGAGVIGAGWAARALHCGYDVIAADTDADMQKWLVETIDTSRPALEELTSDIPMPKRGTLSFTTSLEELADEADFIQENVPENLEVKLRVITGISRLADRDIVIASSTSGFMPGELQAGQGFPERIIVGHPFHPVYLCPLVEVVVGQSSPGSVRDIAGDFYRSLGMHVLQLQKEVPGHLADRLQEAMWREILHSLNNDIATTAELDESIVYGPGLRWAVMGMNQLYMMAGGQGGAEHFLKQFGPALEYPWCHMKAPEMTDILARRFAEGTEQQTRGKSLRELESIRDECMVAIQKVLAKHDMGSGRALNEFARLRKEKAPA